MDYKISELKTPLESVNTSESIGSAKRQVVIVTGGTPVSEQLLKAELALSDYTIAADGGIKMLMKYDIVPNLIVGDFDSAPKTEWLSAYENVPVVTFPKEKDYTDTELAIFEALKLPTEQICILGGTGSRLDHTLANMMLLQRIAHSGKKGRILDDHNEICVLEEGEHIVSKKMWHFFSLVPLSETLVVTLDGFKFPLNKAHIKQASTVTISNEFIGQTGNVKIHSGRAFLILSRD